MVPRDTEVTQPSPFSGHGKRVGEVGETKLIQKVHNLLGTVSPPSPEGIGDDCAVLSPPDSGQLLLTTDPVVYGKHFADDDPPGKVGAKLLKRNLSDIAAMGGQPGPALLALAMGEDLRMEWMAAFVAGLAGACQEYGVHLVGGDITSADEGSFIATLTQTGTASAAISREGADIGSPIYVTGTLGGSLQGKHLDFVPRLPEGQFLASLGNIQSMTDLSDGLAKDLPGLLPSGASASIDSGIVPLHPATNSLEAAFCDGEDYELLFTLEPGTKLKDWPFETPCTKIGEIIQGREGGRLFDSISGDAIEFKKPGYEHFQG